MTALLYDSDNPLSIPLGVNAAGYDDGPGAPAWAAGGWTRFPNALHITLFSRPDSDIFDIETGGGSPSQAPGWAQQRKLRGRVAIVYVNRANGHLVEADLRGAGFSQSEVMLWVATDDGTQTVTVWDDGTPVYYPVWAVQYLNEAHGSGGHYDLSIVYLTYGGGSGIIIEGGSDEMLIQVGDANAYVVGEEGKRLISASELFVWNRAGVTQTKVSQQEADAIPNVPPEAAAGPPGPQGPPGPAGTVAAHDHVIPVGVTEPFTPS